MVRPAPAWALVRYQRCEPRRSPLGGKAPHPVLRIKTTSQPRLQVNLYEYNFWGSGKDEFF
jgi:hypothetical protein